MRPVKDLPEATKGIIFMRIAVPMSGDCLDQHFGHCEKFAFIDIDKESMKTVASTVEQAPEHQHGLLPKWLKEHAVTHVIAGGMGAHARSLLTGASIEVISGAPSIAPTDVVARFLAGTLEAVDRPCDHVCHH